MRGDLANRCHTIRRRLRKTCPPATAGGSDFLAEGTGLEPASDKCAVVFKTTALPVRLPFQKNFGLRIAECEFASSKPAVFEAEIRNPQFLLVHVIGLAPTKDNQVRLIYSQVPLLLSHTCKIDLRSQISNLRFQIPDRFVLKNR